MIDILFWLKLAGNTEMGVLLGAGLLGLVRFRQLPGGLRYLAVLVWFGLAMEIVAAAYHYFHQPNLVLIPFDAAGELWLLSLVYGWALRARRYSRWRPWVAGAFAAYAGLASWLQQGRVQFHPDLLVAESLLVLGLVGLYFGKLLRELQVPRLRHDPMCWVSAGALLYFLGKLLIGLFSNYALHHYSMALNQWVWFVHALLLNLLYGCYAIALGLRPTPAAAPIAAHQ